jgi:hypothetical protein
MKEGAREVSFSRYKAEDGVFVERFVERYVSERQAGEALTKLTISASRVVHEGDKTGADGKRIGRRVELLFEEPQGKFQKAVVAWQDGPRVFVLRSRSWDHVLDFEQQDYPAARPTRKS